MKYCTLNGSSTVVLYNFFGADFIEINSGFDDEWMLKAESVVDLLENVVDAVGDVECGDGLVSE